MSKNILALDFFRINTVHTCTCNLNLLSWHEAAWKLNNYLTQFWPNVQFNCVFPRNITRVVWVVFGIWCVPAAVDCMQRSHGLPRVWRWRLLLDWLPVRRWIVSCHCQLCVLLPSAVTRNFQCGHAHQNNSHYRNLQKGTLQRYYFAFILYAQTWFWFSCASLFRVRQRIYS